MKIVNIHAAKTQLSRLIADVVAGEEVVIAKAGTPLVRLVPVTAGDGPRRLGTLAGAVVESADCWEPDSEVEALFYGGSVEPTPARRAAEPRPKARTRRKKP
ncbi:MAG: type II toxin-antitoxin system prevent-host-death family antitoxin [Gemmatimonadetes bacterium]|nr:type II toxin-antitoxin system prevent-host-death family antitoxin [Gemmatimonadota bacterium]